MDDLSGLDWNAKGGSPPPIQPNYAAASNGVPPAIRPPQAHQALSAHAFSRPSSSLSGKSPVTGSASVRSATPANDSFSNLVPSASTNKTGASLTLQDKQRQLEEEKHRRREDELRRHAQEAHLWDTLDARRKDDNIVRTYRPAGTKHGDIDDVLAAFSSATTVDKSSHFPPPASRESGRSTPASAIPEHQGNGVTSSTFDDDDDPFGLGTLPTSNKAPQPRPLTNAEDDILGELGKPVAARQDSSLRRDAEVELSPASNKSAGTLDGPIAELVDMGFPVETARLALQETRGNVQQAVSFLLNQAHAESQHKSRGKSGEGRTSPSKQNHHTAAEGPVPAWMRADSRSSSKRPERTSSRGDRDVSQYASDVGSTFFKSANSLWKAGRKQVQKAVADFQQDGDVNQPKWMRDASSDSGRSEQRTSDQTQSKGPTQSSQDVTDEALLLESSDGRPQRPRKATSRLPHEPPASSPLRGRSPAQVLSERPAPKQRFPPHATSVPVQSTKLSREQVEQQTAQAYVSSARRRKPATPAARVAEPAVDLFTPAPGKANTTSSAASPRQPGGPVRPASASRTQSVPVSKPTPQPRQARQVAQAVLSQSAQHRAKGTEAFKRGDFDAAHQAYTAALSPLPHDHPIVIIVLSNRALTAIKTGDPKAAVADADRLLGLIGSSRGEGETIDLGTEGQKDMRDFYSKGLMRKAEALEALEKWSDALIVWKKAIETGAGGLIAVRGRERCAKAATPASATASTTKAAPRRSRPAPARPRPSTTASTDAVKKLREQNAAAEKLDDEKFALSDAVSARIEAWRGGKGDNLRALLSTLENVLWEGAGWKKVGIAELVLPNKVKIIYMKAIAKVHPDKISQDATTEQKMVSGSVFSTLNEAWDKFKSDNGL